jgi:outer membrane putative beta-barrel porin/alpha-amylase
MITGFAYSHGGVVTDATLPIQNINADVQSVSVGVAHAFNLFGLSSQALIAVPYSWAQVTGDVYQQATRITRSGIGDMRLRISVLFHGAPAATLAEMRKTLPRKTILGGSLNLVVPTGQFFSEKLINLGTNRWSFRPELALSQRLGKRWTLDAYAGVWLFTNNASFYPGTSLRKQDPMSTFQTHFSYNFNPQMWVAFDATFYTGGSSSVNGVYNDDRQSNARFGITTVVPAGKLSSLKFSASTGAVVRVGQDFSTYSIGWQHSWIPGFKP